MDSKLPSEAPSVQQGSTLRHFYELRKYARGESWKGDVLVADVDELQENDGSGSVLKKNEKQKKFLCRKKGTNSCSSLSTVL